MLAGTATVCPLCRVMWLCSEDKKVKVTAVYCIKAAAFLINWAIHELLKAPFIIHADGLPGDCCPRTRLDAQLKENQLCGSWIISYLLALMSVLQSEGHDQGV